MFERIVWGAASLLGALMILSSLGCGAESTQASASSSNGASQTVHVSVGGFVFPQGATLALELEREDSCTCLCDPVQILGWKLTDSSGETIRETAYDDPPEMEEWIGDVRLRDSEGIPLDGGTYTVEIEATAGSFQVGIEIVAEPPLGRFHVSASVCGLSLRVYRLVTEEIANSTIDLRIGDRLMVMLPGNPTTGYSWSNTLFYEYAPLLEIREPEFRPTGATTGMVGAGGFFIFRYEARDIGDQAFRFLYARPWESSDSDRVLEFRVIVR